MTPRLSRIAVSALIAAVTLGAAPGALAASEQGDAGDLRATAQDLGGASVTQIAGSFPNAVDADLYRVCLSSGASFSATTLGGTTPSNLDTQLFLFSADGRGVYANDDAMDDTRASRLPANHSFSPATGGVYYLGISPFNHDPQSAHGEIFPSTYSRLQFPDDILNATGMGGEGALAAWDGNWRGTSGSYRIALTGTAACDTSAPTVTVSSPLNRGVYAHGESVVADYSCADEAGGSGIATCAGTVADGSPVDTASVGEKTFTVNATDAAGNPASTSVTYTVVDRSPPTVALSAPADGAVYVLGQRVLAAYSCEDQAGGSGVATCDGPVANGAAIDTSTVGAHSFEVRTADNAGNADSTTVSYSVVYDFDGFFSPVQNPPKWTRWKAGAPVPVRFSLGGYHGPRPEAAGYPRSRPCGGGEGELVTRAAKKKPVFDYERRSGRYSLRWKTDRRWAGTCREFVLKLDDGSMHTARFQFTKRGYRDRGDK